jgi:hypothetical protein
MTNAEITLLVLLGLVFILAVLEHAAAYRCGVHDGYGYSRDPGCPGYQKAGEYLRRTMAHRWPELRCRDRAADNLPQPADDFPPILLDEHAWTYDQYELSNFLDQPTAEDGITLTVGGEPMTIGDELRCIDDDDTEAVERFRAEVVATARAVAAVPRLVRCLAWYYAVTPHYYSDSLLDVGEVSARLLNELRCADVTPKPTTQPEGDR